MTPLKKLSFVLLLVTACSVVPNQLFAQAYKDAVGYNELLAEKGGSLEDGTGILVMQAEAPTGAGNYMADSGHAQFTGKTFIDGTGSSTDGSAHATGVGVNFYGNSSSMTPGITSITGYDANDYIGRILNFGGGDPLAQGFDIGNHSYIGNGLTPAEVVQLSMRFDYVINRDNTVMVVGANNGSGSTTPDLFAPSYNAITVGLTNGNHSRGLTADYGPGRFKPDIVAPATTTSNATPLVASAAALLRHAGAATNAAQNQVVKSLLFAGATKEEVIDWDRTTTRPIDEVYGFGELNILNSYHILEGGEFAASTSDPATDVGHMGWDFGNFNGSDDLFYDFEILAGREVSQLSAALVWNVDVIDANASAAVFDASIALANLDLELYDSTGTFLGSLVDSSLSTEYNMEHIYLTSLAEGNYTFRITGDSDTDFGFAWRISSVPEPTSGIVLGLGLIGLASRRRRP